MGTLDSTNIEGVIYGISNKICTEMRLLDTNKISKLENNFKKSIRDNETNIDKIDKIVQDLNNLKIDSKTEKKKEIISNVKNEIQNDLLVM